MSKLSEVGNKITFMTGSSSNNTLILFNYEIDRVSGSAIQGVYSWWKNKDDVSIEERWNILNYKQLLEHKAECKPVKPLF